MPRLNTCELPTGGGCGHYTWAHGPNGCTVKDCKCKATDLAFKVLENDRLRDPRNQKEK